jgi:glycosyltransferase involved in cell wall biosynthesis
MSRKLNICHVITRMIVGGAQENTLLTIRGHLEHGHRVTLFTGPSPGPEGSLLHAESISGMETRLIPSLVRPIHPLKDWRAYRALTRAFREGAFDVVHTHSSKAGILGRMAASRAKIPFVVHTVHGQAFHPYQSGWKNAVYIAAERVAARHCDRILAVAQAMVDQCVEAGIAPAEKYRVVYSGMRIDAFLDARPEPELRRRLGIAEDAVVIGKVARLFELKGHDYLINAAPAIVAAFPNAVFLLVGDGVLRERLEADIRRAGLQDHFFFSGLVPPDEVCRYIALMDVLVHLSLREGLPRAVVQALAAGVPAVGFSLDGTPEVIRDGETGFLCAPGDVDAVTRSVNALLADPARAREMGARGQEIVREQFSWKRMADIIEEEYYRGLSAAGWSGERES